MKLKIFKWSFNNQYEMSNINFGLVAEMCELELRENFDKLKYTITSIVNVPALNLF